MQNYILTTFNGEKIIISGRQEEVLKTLPMNKNINLSGKTINTSDIAQITPTTKSERVPYTKAKQISVLESMLKGLSKCIAEQGYPASPKQQVLRDKINTALEKAKQLGDNEKTDFDIRKFI